MPCSPPRARLNSGPMTGTARDLSRPAPMRAARFILLASGMVVVLGGCEDTRKILGMDKNPPDQFRIVSPPPLTMPPDYTLRPPQPGAARPQADNPTDTARSALVVAGGAKPGSGSAPDATAGESLIVQRVANGSR